MHKNEASSLLAIEEIKGKQGNIGVIILERPQALNALTVEMVMAISKQLYYFEQSKQIKAVLIRSHVSHAFCAGADLRALYTADEKGENFFWHEYNLNRYLACYSKPYLCLLQGITFGGGAGFSFPGRYRITTENLQFAMPETKIGWFPDVGSGHFFSRLPFKIGYYLSLTGNAIDADTCVKLKLADYILPEKDILPWLLNLAASPPISGWIEQSLEPFKLLAKPSSLQPHYEIIQSCFSQQSITEIIFALRNENSSWANKVANELLQRCPFSLMLTLKQLSLYQNLDFAECLKLDYRLASRLRFSKNFYEGIRAQIIDKDKKPHWQPADFSAISLQEIENLFAPIFHELF